MKTWLRISLVALILAVVVTGVLSLAAFGENESADGAVITPVDGVYTVENASQFTWLLKNMSSKSVASSTIVLANDIDVDGTLVTAAKPFSGVLDGNGKTISGVTSTLFTQFNGTAKNLTLRGKDSAAAQTASFAQKASSATLTNVISYVGVQALETDKYVGGLIASADGKTTLTDCAYNGTITVDWKQANLSLGGIIGYTQPDKAMVIDGAVFGGKITVSGGMATKKACVGGILGLSEKGSVTLKNCVSKGEILSTVTAGDDYVGGIFGLCEDTQKTIEYCSNMSTIKAVKNAGGILGGINANVKIVSCANHTDVTAAKAGSFCGNGNKSNLTCFSSYDFAKTSNKFCSTSFTSNSSLAADAITFEKTFTLGGKEYDKYSVGTIDKATGLPIRTMKTHTMFEAFVSVREDGKNTEALRFMLLTNCTCTSKSVTVKVEFKDFGGKVIKSFNGILGGEGSNMDLYAAVTASGENYFAADGCAIFGCVITGVPVGAWDTAELSVVDTKTGEVYLSPVSIDGYSAPLTMDTLPDLSGLGKVSEVYNCGPGLMSDKEGTTEEDTYMTVISDTSKEKFEAYVKGLEAAGFTFISKNTLDGDDYYSYAKNNRLLYLYYTSRVNEIRVICDNSSDSLAKISSDYVVKEGDQVQFYQYSINYTGHDKEGYDPVTYTESGLMDCGMFYMLKTADNKIIMIDGGHSGQLSATAKKYLVNYMHEITGIPAKEKITIAAWYITHAHGDHVAVARDFLNSYYNQIELESVIFNFPLYGNIDGYDDNTFGLKEAIRTRYPNTQYHKLHTGEVISFGGVDLEVLYTHEDAVSTAGRTELSEFNSSSTVVKFVFDNKSVIVLGDVYHTGANVILKMHSKEYLKSDVLQVAHHGYNDMANLYKAICAPIALFPNAMTAKDHSTYKTVMAFSKEAYFAHKWTYRLTVENGKIQVTEVKRYDQK